MSCPTNHRNIDPRRFDGGHTYCYDCKQHVEVVHTHYANGERPPVQAARILAKLNAEQPLPPHQFITVAPEAAPEGEAAEMQWEWCPLCGTMRLGNEYFVPKPVETTSQVMVGVFEPTPCVPR